MLSNDIIDDIDHFEIEWDVTNKVIIHPDDPEYDTLEEFEYEDDDSFEDEENEE